MLQRNELEIALEFFAVFRMFLVRILRNTWPLGIQGVFGVFPLRSPMRKLEHGHIFEKPPRNLKQRHLNSQQRTSTNKVAVLGKRIGIFPLQMANVIKQYKCPKLKNRFFDLKGPCVHMVNSRRNAEFLFESNSLQNLSFQFSFCIKIFFLSLNIGILKNYICLIYYTFDFNAENNKIQHKRLGVRDTNFLKCFKLPDSIGSRFGRHSYSIKITRNSCVRPCVWR